MIVGSKTERYTVARCNQCGDSKNPRHGHLLVFADGGTYCCKCGESSSLSIGALLAIATGATSIDEALDGSFEDWRELYRAPQAAPPRFTRLDTFTTDLGANYWAFQMRNAKGDVVGWHNRDKTSKNFHNEGNTGLGYVGSRLVSKPNLPLTIVEGPYDCILDRYVCLFGALTKARLCQLRLQWVWLYPDPDWLDTKQKRDKFARMVADLIDNCMVFVQGVIIGNDDPDKATQEIHVPTDQLVGWLIE